MKKYLIVLFTVLISIIVSEDVRPDVERTKIAVLDFQLLGTDFANPHFGKSVADSLTTALVQAGRVDIVERRALEKVLSELEFGLTGVVDQESRSKLGNVFGAKVVITGSISKFRQYTKVNARLINVETGSVIAAEEVKESSALMIDELIPYMARKISNNFPLEGYVLVRKGASVTIDLGKLAGVRKGMEFIVYIEGEVIRHPKTGEILDITRIDIGEVEVVKVKKKVSKARILDEESGQEIERGQLVRSSDEEVEKKVGIYKQKDEEVAKRVEVYKKEVVASEWRYTTINVMIKELEDAKAGGEAISKTKGKQAVRNIKIALKRQPRDPELCLHLARWYWLYNNYRGAYGWVVKKSLALKPDYTKAHLFKGEINHQMAIRGGRGKQVYRDRAWESYLRVTSQGNTGEDDRALAYLRLGDIASGIDKDPAVARKHWESASRLRGSAYSSEAAEKLRR
ncbi:MAG: hypothetical protein GY941_29565 [Planctomycetes bacterium]|nr:hypothetical protein [Planctomycetota bacterium]